MGTYYFPISLDIHDRHCIVIGGGRVAARKVGALLDGKARVTVISPKLDERLARLAETEEVRWINRGYRHGDLAGAFLVIAATDDTAVQEAVHAEAEAGNLLLNVADVPKWCNFILPATVRRGDLTISVSTGGNSPALAKRMRRQLGGLYGDEYELLLLILGQLRPVVLGMGHSHEENKVIFEQLLHHDMIDWIRDADWTALTTHVRAVLGQDVPLDTLLGRTE